MKVYSRLKKSLIYLLFWVCRKLVSLSCPTPRTWTGAKLLAPSQLSKYWNQVSKLFIRMNQTISLILTSGNHCPCYLIDFDRLGPPSERWWRRNVTNGLNGPIGRVFGIQNFRLYEVEYLMICLKLLKFMKK